MALLPVEVPHVQIVFAAGVGAGILPRDGPDRAGAVDIGEDAVAQAASVRLISPRSLIARVSVIGYYSFTVPRRN